MEGFRGERGPERGPERDIEEYKFNINKLLAKLIESGPELDPYYVKLLRRYIHEVLGIFGSQDEGFESLLKTTHYHAPHDPLPTRGEYPSLQKFQRNLLEIVIPSETLVLPEVPSQILATDVANYSQYNWLEIQATGGYYTLDYLYELGKVMISKPVYEALFPQSDNIVIEEGWEVVNGPQRALVLKTLGADFIERRGMNEWVDVHREPSV